jgi:hypothetical protein
LKPDLWSKTLNKDDEGLDSYTSKHVNAARKIMDKWICKKRDIDKAELRIINLAHEVIANDDVDEESLAENPMFQLLY